MTWLFEGAGADIKLTLIIGPLELDNDIVIMFNGLIIFLFNYLLASSSGFYRPISLRIGKGFLWIQPL